MQVELLNRRRLRTHLEVSTALFEHLEIFRNRQRRHSALGMRSPVEYELHADEFQDLLQDFSREPLENSSGPVLISQQRP